MMEHSAVRPMLIPALQGTEAVWRGKRQGMARCGLSGGLRGVHNCRRLVMYASTLPVHTGKLYARPKLLVSISGLFAQRGA